MAQAKKDAWEAVGLGGSWAETIGDMAGDVLREAVILGVVLAASAIPVVGPFIVGAYFAWQAYEGAKVVYSGVQDVFHDDPDYLGGGLKIGLGAAQVVGSLFGLGRVVKATATPLLKRLASTLGADDALPSAPPKVNVKTVSSNADPKCFPAGTIISTSQGLRSIETIRVGDHVWAFDLMSAQWHLRTVLELYEFEYQDEIVEVTVENGGRKGDSRAFSL